MLIGQTNPRNGGHQMLLLLTQQGFTSQQCDKVIHVFIEPNVAYMEPGSPDLIDGTFEEEAVRLIFVMVIHFNDGIS